MASPTSHRLLSLGFMLIVLCLHQCSARKVLMEDLKKQEHNRDIVPTPTFTNISPGPFDHYNPNLVNDIPFPPGPFPNHVYDIPPGPFDPNLVNDIPFPPGPFDPNLVNDIPFPPGPFPGAPDYIAPSCTPCLPDLDICPCPPLAEGAAEMDQGIKAEGHDESNNKAQEGEKQGSSLLSSKEKMQDGAVPSMDDAPLPAVVDGSN